MWPWGHLAVGYIAYATYTRYWDDERPAGLPVVLLAVATQLPDLLDKPLAYAWAVLPAGRSFAHSSLIALPICVTAVLLARQSRPVDERAGMAFAVGYVTHLLGDAVYPLLAVDLPALSFLVWPLRPLPADEVTSLQYYVDSLLESIRSLEAVPVPFVVELLLFVLAAGLWIHHRMPPLPGLAQVLGRGEASAGLGERND